MHCQTRVMWLCEISLPMQLFGKTDVHQWLVENIVDSSLCLLNDGRITRIPDVSTHKATAIDLSPVTPDLAVNSTWYTEEDCLGGDHLPIIIEWNENIKDDEPEDEDKIPKFKYKHADWEAYQAFLLSSEI